MLPFNTLPAHHYDSPRYVEAKQPPHPPRLLPASPFLLCAAEQSLGMGTELELLTNAELLKILHPTNLRLPYVYEHMETWGTRSDGGLCPECAEVAADAAGRRSP